MIKPTSQLELRWKPKCAQFNCFPLTIRSDRGKIQRSNGLPVGPQLENRRWQTLTDAESLWPSLDIVLCKPQELWPGSLSRRYSTSEQLNTCYQHNTVYGPTQLFYYKNNSLVFIKVLQVSSHIFISRLIIKGQMYTITIKANEHIQDCAPTVHRLCADRVVSL